MSSRLLLAPIALLMLSACNTVPPAPHPLTGSMDPGFGEAVKYDMAIQVIDPDPVYTEEGSQPGDSGAKGAEAVKRYRTDKVKDVDVMETTSGSASGPQ